MDIPYWLQHWLGAGTAPGEGVAVKLHVHWPWPAYLTVVAILVMILFVVRTYRKEQGDLSRADRLGLLGLRLAILAIVLAMLGQWALTIERTGLPVLAVVRDDSASMALRDRYSEAEARLLARVFGDLDQKPQRFELAQQILSDSADWVSQWSRNYRVRVFSLEGNDGVDWNRNSAKGVLRQAKPVRDRSPLGRAVLAAWDSLRGSPPAAVVVLSDGISNEGPDWSETAAELRRRGIPLYFVALGRPGSKRDVALSDLRVDDAAFLHDVVFADVRIEAEGFPGKRVPIRVVDESSNATLAASEIVMKGSALAENVRLVFQVDQVGTLNLRVEVPVQVGEMREENNVLRHSIRVLDEPIRVLYVEGMPRFEYRYLRNLLLREPSVTLDCVLQSADPEYATDAKSVLSGVPMRRDELWRYDVIVLGDVDPAWFPRSTLENIRDFVRESEKSGAVVFIAGERFMPHAFRETPLASLLPFEADRDGLRDAAGKSGLLRVAPTELGKESPGMQWALDPRQNAAAWESLPDLYWYLPLGDLKPGARVLAVHASDRGWNGDPEPIIVFQYVGGGKVLFHATDETWRWRYRGGQGRFSRYWVQTLRFLARNKLERGRGVTLQTNQRVYRAGEPVILRAVFRPGENVEIPDDSVTVFMERDGDARSQLRLERRGLTGDTFEGRGENLLPGSYRAWIPVAITGGAEVTTNFEIEPPRRETEETEPDFAGMEEAARQTGGGVYRPWQLRQLSQSLPPGQSIAVERLPPVTLWNRPLVLLLLLGLLTSEWLIRKLRGLA